MADLGTTMRRARSERGWTQSDLGDRLSADTSLISKRETGRLGVPHEEIERLVAATGIPLVVTPDGWGMWNPTAATVEFYGPAPCGSPLYIEDAEPEPVELGDVIEEPLQPGRNFILRAEGDSMFPVIGDGDWIVVDRQRTPQINEVVAANLNGGLTIKRVVPHQATGRLCLMPDNQAHAPIELDDGDEVQVLGVVVGVLRHYIKLTGPDPIAKAQQTKKRKRP
jgi:SOS-response transcriptional repressor LexA